MPWATSRRPTSTPTRRRRGGTGGWNRRSSFASAHTRARARADEPEVATIVAIKLARDNIYRSSDAQAGAWLQRAERLLEGVDENPGHGWLAVSKAFRAAVTGDMALAMAEAIKAEAIAVAWAIAASLPWRSPSMASR